MKVRDRVLNMVALQGRAVDLVIAAEDTGASREQVITLVEEAWDRLRSSIGEAELAEQELAATKEPSP